MQDFDLTEVDPYQTASLNRNTCFQSQKRLYNHQCPSICQSIKPLNTPYPSSFVVHSLSIILHPSLILRLSIFSACF